MIRALASSAGRLASGLPFSSRPGSFTSSLTSPPNDFLSRISGEGAPPDAIHFPGISPLFRDQMKSVASGATGLAKWSLFLLKSFPPLCFFLF